MNPPSPLSNFFSGQSAKPKTKSLQGGFKKKEDSGPAFQKKEESDVQLSEGDLRKENAELKKRVAYLEAEIAKLSSQ